MRRAIRYSMLSAVVLLLAACSEDALLHEPVIESQEAPTTRGGRDRCAASAVEGPQAVPDRRGCEEDDAGGRPAEA